jgi:hypothetical protein
MFATILALAAPCVAQTITLINPDGARAGVKVGYGGRGPDVSASIDSPQFGGLRMRLDAGIGRWVGMDSQPPPAGTNPVVGRVAAMAILTWRPYPENFRPMIGLGYAAYVPHHQEMLKQRGVRVLLGFDCVVDQWSVAPEIELDVPSYGGRPMRTGADLLPTHRFGIAVRRRF